MQGFFDNLGFIIGFLVMVLIWNVALGAKATKYFLILVLLSMLILNYAPMSAFITETFTTD